jgi:hypothetical protein
METCENCGRAIGNLETPNVHDGHVVCAKCKAILQPETAMQLISPPPDLPAVDPVNDELRSALVDELENSQAKRIAGGIGTANTMRGHVNVSPADGRGLVGPLFGLFVLASLCFFFFGQSLLTWVIFCAWVALFIVWIVRENP